VLENQTKTSLSPSGRPSTQREPGGEILKSGRKKFKPNGK